MATFVKVNDFVEDLALKLHDLATDQLVIALSNTAPGSETPDPTADTNGILTNVTEIAYTNLSSRNVTTTSLVLASGVVKLTLTDLVLTASGSVAAFRYVYLYNGDAVADNLIAVWDKGAEVNMVSPDTFTVDFDGSNGVLTVT